MTNLSNVENVIITAFNWETEKEQVLFPIDKTNAFNMKSDGFFLGTVEEQKENLQNWLNERANEMYETIFEIVSWEFV